MKTYSSEHNAIRGFRRNYKHLAHLSNDMIRCDFINSDDDVYTISLEAVADYEADRMGETKTQRIAGVPMVRRSTTRKGAVARVRAYFDQLPEGTARKDAVASAVEAGFAYATARTQYQNWKNA